MVRGEIWWAKLPTPKGSEPGYKRPVIIIQADEFNRSMINTVICAVITSNVKLAEAPGNILLHKADSNLPRESVINVSQIITINKSFLFDCIGTISRKMMKKLDEGLRLVMDLP
jgi:mRNA interferase MazF